MPKREVVYVCLACGKTSKDKYGDPGSLWDESCMLNSVLCYTDKLIYSEDTGRIQKVEEGGVIDEEKDLH